MVHDHIFLWSSHFGLLILRANGEYFGAQLDSQYEDKRIKRQGIITWNGSWKLIHHILRVLLGRVTVLMLLVLPI